MITSAGRWSGHSGWSEQYDTLRHKNMAQINL